MPGPYLYPGIYIEEVPSGVRTIAGVSTSDTAFVDFFKRGPLNQATRITSFGDFERIFGGLDTRSEASYAIRQFYLNGGNIAWVVRVAGGTVGAANGPAAATLTLQAGSPPQNTLTIEAASPGLWGQAVQVSVNSETRDPNRYFNLLVREVALINGREQAVTTETHRNLSLDSADPRYVVDVIEDASALIRVVDLGLGDLPNPSGFQALAGSPSDGIEPGSTEWQNSAGSAALIGSPSPDDKRGLYALDGIAPFVFNLLCIPAAAELPPSAMQSVVQDATTYCREKRAFLLVDIPSSIATPGQMVTWMGQNDGLRSDHSAVYFPRLYVVDSLNENRLRNVAASGTLAGIYARTDAIRGVWKAPAGTDADLRGGTPTFKMTDDDNGQLNPLGINALRNFPVYGNVAWGARTLDGADQAASEWKYIPVRRMALYIEESLYQSLKWVVFEPNDEPLWAQIRLNVGAFMQDLFRQGAFQGKSPREAYFVKCDRETTTQTHINQGIVNLMVGFAPLRPAEFLVIQIQQMAGQLET